MLSMNGQDYEFGCSCLTKKRSIDESFVSICTNYNKYAKYIFPQTFSLRNKIGFIFIRDVFEVRVLFFSSCYAHKSL